MADGRAGPGDSGSGIRRSELAGVKLRNSHESGTCRGDADDPPGFHSLGDVWRAGDIRAAVACGFAPRVARVRGRDRTGALALPTYPVREFLRGARWDGTISRAIPAAL